MDKETKPGWRKFQNLSFDSKSVKKRARKAETATLRHARKFVGKRLGNIADVRRHVILWVVGISSLILAVGLQQIWFQESYQHEVAIGGGTYAEATLGAVETLNPLYATTSSEISASRLLFSSLLNYDTDGRLANDLARKMTISPDGLTYTLELRDGIRWHDDTRLSADDVIFTIELIKDPETRSPLQQQWQSVTAKKVDDKTVQFSLTSIYAPFPHALTFAVLPKHILEEVAPNQLRQNSFSLSPVGSGPFKLRFLQSEGENKIVNLSAYEDYYKGSPKLQRFELHAFEKQDEIQRALTSGRVTATADLDNPESERTNNLRKTSTHVVDGGTFAFFNTSQPALQDKNIRRALQLALDIDKVRDVTGTKNNPLNSPLVPGQVTATDLTQQPARSVSEAERILTEAGWIKDGDYRKKDGQELSLELVTTDRHMYVETAKVISASWRAIGVNVKTTVVDTSDPMQDFTQNILQPRAYDVLIYELSIGADPDVYAYWHSSQATQRGLNLSLYSNPVSDDNLASARSRVESDLRDAKYKTFIRQWVDDTPAVALFQSTVRYVSSVQAVNMTEAQNLVSPYDRYSNVIHWSVARGAVYKTP